MGNTITFRVSNVEAPEFDNTFKPLFSVKRFCFICKADPTSTSYLFAKVSTTGDSEKVPLLNSVSGSQRGFTTFSI